MLAAVDHVYVAMFGGLPGKPTGLAMSVLRRAEAFSEAGIRTEILVDHFYPDFDLQMQELKGRGRVGGAISVRYLYHDLAGEGVYGEDMGYVSPLETSGWEYKPMQGNPEVLVGELAEKYKRRVLLRGERVLFIDHLEDGQWISRTWHDVAGSTCKVERMGPTGRARTIEFVDRAGNCYLEQLLDEESQRVLKCELYPRSTRSRTFRNMVEVFQYWLQSIVLVGDPAPVIISEYGARRMALEALEHENNACVIYTIHNSHLRPPYHYGSDVRPEMADLLSHLDRCHGAVVLTEEQRQDIFKQYGWLDSLHVIPHFMPPTSQSLERDAMKVVMVGRFDRIKGQSSAIRAFSRVVQMVPDAKLVFYGRGSEEEAMRKQIVDLGLQDSISIAGFTANATEVFQGASMSIVASDYEGFCLSLGESMAAGCIPVSYDIKYGPRELIKNGISGFLVQPGNIKEMADAIVLGLSDPARAEIMSQNAMQIQGTLSKQRFIDEWETVLSRSVAARDSRSDMAQPR